MTPVDPEMAAAFIDAQAAALAQATMDKIVLAAALYTMLQTHGDGCEECAHWRDLLHRMSPKARAEAERSRTDVPHSS